MKKTITFFAIAALAYPFFTKAQNITTIVGTPQNSGYMGDGGPATAARISNPYDVKFDNSGNMYISDAPNQCIRKVNTNGIISTIAGTGSIGYSGDGGQATAADLDYPYGLAIDGAGNIYFADDNNHIVRKINTSGIITTIAGNHSLGAGYSGDGGQATAAELYSPTGLAFDMSGNLYISEYDNNTVRKVNTSGVISTVAGNYSLGGGYTGDGGSATAAQLYHPQCIAFDGSGNLFIADGGNNVVRMVNVSGKISTFAGTYPGGGYNGDGGPATAAVLNRPVGIIVGPTGAVFIDDGNNNVIRMVNYTGKIYTIAGDSALGAGYSGDGGPATAAQLSVPSGLAIDHNGLLNIADYGNNIIRKLSMPLAVNEIISKTKVEIYPNPSSGLFNFSIKNEELGVNNTVDVYNMLGERIYSQPFSIQNSMFHIDLSSQPKGIYLYRITSQQGTAIASGKLVIE